MTSHPMTEDELQAYVDDVLLPERRAAVEAHLARHPADAERVAAYRAQKQALKALFGEDIGDIRLVSAMVAFTLFEAAYYSEIIRAGIQSVDIGQMEAGRSLGLPYWKTMRKIILPQAIRTMIPSIINQFIITVKDTSILSVIGFPELVNTAKNVVANSFMSFQTWGIVAVMYLIVITILSKVAKIVERRLNRGRK